MLEHHSLLYLESSLWHYQAISLLKKLNKSTAKVFQSQSTVSTKPPDCAGVQSACSEAAASPFCVTPVGRGLGGRWCMAADLSGGGRRVPKHSQEWQVSYCRGQCSPEAQTRRVWAGTACDLQCVTSSPELDPTLCHTLLSELLECFPLANP